MRWFVFGECQQEEEGEAGGRGPKRRKLDEQPRYNALRDWARLGAGHPTRSPREVTPSGVIHGLRAPVHESRCNQSSEASFGICKPKCLSEYLIRGLTQTWRPPPQRPHYGESSCTCPHLPNWVSSRGLC